MDDIKKNEKLLADIFGLAELPTALSAEEAEEQWKGIFLVDLTQIESDPSNPAKESLFSKLIYRKHEYRDAYIEWAVKTGQFSKKEIIRLHRLRIFNKSSATLQIQPPILSNKVGSWIVSMIIGCAIAWVGCAIFVFEAKPTRIFDALAVGLGLGFILNIALDLSFRHVSLIAKISKTSDWISNSN